MQKRAQCEALTKANLRCSMLTDQTKAGRSICKIHAKALELRFHDGR